MRDALELCIRRPGINLNVFILTGFHVLFESGYPFCFHVIMLPYQRSLASSFLRPPLCFAPPSLLALTFLKSIRGPIRQMFLRRVNHKI